MEAKAHWENVYSTKAPDAVSWFQQHAEQSLRLIQETEVPTSAAIIDVGGGASTLVDDLLAKGFTHLIVLDLSAAALKAAQHRLGSRASLVNWVEADITKAMLPKHGYDVWHDRAAFHFLTDRSDRQAYVQAVLNAVKPGGHVIVATFGPEGPNKCSGLDVVRYDPEALHREFGSEFRLVKHAMELHQTPIGSTQQFTYCYFKVSEELR
jgi:SAM-dependent methyltransferase